MSQSKPIKQVLFTFDYELYLGAKSGSVNKCVLEPTERMLGIFAGHKARGIVFVDTTWLMRLKEVSGKYEKAKLDYDKVISQIRAMAKAGHYIFPHLHPHWLDATYIEDTNQWTLTDYSKYRFNAINKEQRDFIFHESVTILKEAILPINPNYIPIGYRAGGWSIEPFEDFEPYFRQYGIQYDFSVLSGRKIQSSTRSFDYSKAEFDLPYKFSNSVSVPQNGDFAELPISNIKISPLIAQLNRILEKYLWLNNDRGSGDGAGVVVSDGYTSGSEKASEMISIELLTTMKLSAYLDFLKKHRYMQFISHPKMLSQHNIITFEKFINTVFKKYEVETDFLKMIP
jgi:hypothetical protein